MEQIHKILTPIITKNYNWIKIGGKAKLLKVNDIKTLSSTIQKIGKKYQYVVIGSGSNVIFNSNNMDLIVIKLGRNFNYIEKISHDKLKIGASVLGFNLAKKALEMSLIGLEFAVGIPGTIGGMCKMNAGCYGVEMKDIIYSITFINETGKIITKYYDELKFEYRKCNFPDKWIVIHCVINIKYGDQNQIKNKIDTIIKHRQETQPTSEFTCGSTFMNHSKYKAWELIKKTGMNEKEFGDISFSKKHCNFLINKGNSTSEEALKLILETQKKVKEMFKIELSLEIKLIGM